MDVAVTPKRSTAGRRHLETLVAHVYFAHPAYKGFRSHTVVLGSGHPVDGELEASR